MSVPLNHPEVKLNIQVKLLFCIFYSYHCENTDLMPTYNDLNVVAVLVIHMLITPSTC